MKTAPFDNRVFGLKVWYVDNMIRISAADIAEQWPQLPRNGVQVVSIVDRVSYNGENLHLAQNFASYDYYWFHLQHGFGATNRPSDIPEGAHVLTGSEIDKSQFIELYNRAINDHLWR